MAYRTAPNRPAGGWTYRHRKLTAILVAVAGVGLALALILLG